jgi:hypothetical protein
MPAQYHFLSEYAITSGHEAVWTALVDVGGWTGWWSWLRRLDVIRPPAGPDGVGAIYRNTVKAPSGYGFVYDTEIEAVDHGRRIDVLSSGGISGRGRFLLEPREDGGTNLGFAWLVETPARWMNVLAPIARPAFTWNHDKLMSDFGAGLARATGGSLAFVRNSTRKPGSELFWVMPEELAIPI